MNLLQLRFGTWLVSRRLTYWALGCRHNEIESYPNDGAELGAGGCGVWGVGGAGGVGVGSDS